MKQASATRCAQLLGLVIVVLGSSADAGPVHTSCPYEPPLDNKGEFDVERIAERDLFPLLPSHNSSLGATAVTGSYLNRLNDGDNLQSVALNARYGGPELHRMLHASGSIELPFAGALALEDGMVRSADPWPPRWDVGLGIHDISGFLGGYAHLGWGVRFNYASSGDALASPRLHPFEQASGDFPLRVTEELRLGIAGCRAPFAQVTFEQRSVEELKTFEIKIPARLMVGFFIWRLGFAAELGVFYDPGSDDEELLASMRLLTEILVSDHWRLGGSLETLIKDRKLDPQGDNGAWIGQVYVQWLL